MNTISNTQWRALCEKQVQRALAGDAKAAEWCARHAPTWTPGFDGDSDVSGVDLSKLSTEQLKAMLENDDICPHCGIRADVVPVILHTERGRAALAALHDALVALRDAVAEQEALTAGQEQANGR